MASREIYAGDTFPPVYLEISDETGVLDLSTATGLLAIFDGKTHAFSGTAVAIQPALVDPDGIHQWNCKYVLTTGNTAQPDVYSIFLKVTWSVTDIETFATGDTLTILAAPTP